MAETSIEWSDKVWNPVRGCSLVGPGCTNCYAMKQAHRFSAPGQPYAGLTRLRTKGGPVWTGTVREVPEMLGEPLRWRKPSRVFVNSMSDLFHEDVSDDFIEAVFGVMQSAGHHTFQVLTKRPERMQHFMSHASAERCAAEMVLRKIDFESPGGRRDRLRHDPPGWTWPPRNVWLGVSVEDQQRAEERIPHLLATPAAVRFLSCEPLLGPLTIGLRGVIPATIARGYAPVSSRIDWAIVGGESGPGARPCHAGWVHNLVREFVDVEVPIFVKQAGAYVVDRNDVGFEAETVDPPDPESWPTPVRVEEDLCGYRDGYQGAPVRVHLKDPKGGDPQEWPAGLRVRQFPEVPRG